MLVSQAEYARIRGFSRQYVGQMAAKGIVRLKGRKIDTDQADAALAAIRDPVRSEKRSKPQNKSAPLNNPVDVKITEPVFPQTASDLPTLLLKTRIKSEVERAKLLEIKARVESGKYVDADEMKTAAFNRARVVRDGLLNIPDRLASILATESDATRVHEILTAEIRTVLEELIGGSERG